MATIGTFKKSGQEFTGEIVTLRSRPRTSASSPRPLAPAANAPSHRVYVGRVEIGAAWNKRSNEGRDYLGSSSTIRALRPDLRQPLRR